MIESEGFHELLRQARAGDGQAMNWLVAILRPRLEQLARGYADPDRPDESASDLVQEAWLRVWQKLGQFRGAADNEQTAAVFHDWVGQIVRHLGLNRERDRNAQRRRPPQKPVRLAGGEPSESSSHGGGIDPAAGTPTPSATIQADEQAQMVRAAIERIPDTTDRTIVRLRFFDCLSLRQIAERLNLSYDKVRDRYQASMRLLERELGGLL